MRLIFGISLCSTRKTIRRALPVRAAIPFKSTQQHDCTLKHTHTQLLCIPPSIRIRHAGVNNTAHIEKYLKAVQI